MGQAIEVTLVCDWIYPRTTIKAKRHTWLPDKISIMRLFLSSLALVVLSSTAAAAEPVKVFGLPLGGTMKPAPNCGSSPKGKYSAEGICWVYKTSTSRSYTSGQISLRDSDSVPRWAVLAEFKPEVRNNILSTLTVVTNEIDDAAVITESISARFGKPRMPKAERDTQWYATWTRPEIAISLVCSRGTCHARFVSAETHAEEMRRINEVVRRDAARPISP